MKRLIVLLCAAVLLTGAVACSKQETATTETVSTDTVSPDTAASDTATGTSQTTPILPETDTAGTMATTT